MCPHIASASVRTRTNMAKLAAENIVKVLTGEAPLTPVNPEGARAAKGKVLGAAVTGISQSHRCPPRSRDTAPGSGVPFGRGLRQVVELEVAGLQDLRVVALDFSARVSRDVHRAQAVDASASRVVMEEVRTAEDAQ